MNINGTIYPFVVFRGTQTSCEWNLDFTHTLVNPSWLASTKWTNVNVHDGFNTVYTSQQIGETSGTSPHDVIWNYIQTRKPSCLFITGHSLGGALTYLTTADITANIPGLKSNLHTYTVAGPYTGDQNFVDLLMSSNTSKIYSGIFSIINNDDPVPNARFTFQYVRPPVQLFCFKISAPNPHLPSVYYQGLQENGSKWDIEAHILANCGMICKWNI